MKTRILQILIVAILTLTVFSCTEEVVKPKDGSDLPKDPKGQF